MNRPFRSVDRQRGVTLTELMIALVLGALVVLAATAMVVTSRATYSTQDETTRLAESARFGLELTNRMVRLAGYTQFGDDPRPPPFYSSDPSWNSSVAANAYLTSGPNIVGANNAKPTGGAAVNGSDALTIRYFGSGPGATTAADGNVLDCAGVAVPPPLPIPTSYNASRASNVLFVDLDASDGEPTLMCQRQTYDATTGAPLVRQTQALIRGVESFQVLYGEAIYAAGPPAADPDSSNPVSIVYRTGIGGPNPVGNWNNVIAVRIAMLLRSNVGAQVDPGAVTYNLFGTSYPGSSDPGSQFGTSALSSPERTRVRRVVETTVFVRNRISAWPSLNNQ